MKNTSNSFAVKASTLAVRGALITLATLPSAYAQSASDLTKPTSSLEVGIGYSDKDSYKAGEYSGMEQKGGYFLGGFDVKGGGAYDSDNALRFRITASDLGLDTRKLGAEFGEQGKFRLTFGYDEIVKNRSDSYQTPYLGAGTNNQTLPANWATNLRNCSVQRFTGVGGVVGTAGCGNYYVTQNTGTAQAVPTGDALRLTAAEKSDFQNFNLSTQRKKSDLGFSFNFDSQWQFSAGARHETKQGAQTIGQPIGSATGSQVTLAQPIDYTTNMFDAKLSWKGARGFAEGAYYGSIFQNGIQSTTYQDPYFSSAVPSAIATLAASATSAGGAVGTLNYPFPDLGRFSSAPNNQSHQFKLTGGYDVTKTTKLVGDYSYMRNTQDQAYIPYATGVWQNTRLPATSLNGEVVIQAFNLKLTDRTFKNLKLGAAFKYDDRDNRTPGTTGWKFTEADLQTPFTPGTLPTANNGLMNVAGGVSAVRPSGVGVITTLPYHRRVEQWNLDADWSFSKGQALKAGYENQKLQRHCSATVFDCANVGELKEDSWRLEYRNNLLENVTGRIGYVNGNRTNSTYTNSPYLGAGLAPDTLTRFMYADRKRDKLRASVNWQANDALDFTVGYDYNKDRFKLGENPAGITALYPAGGQPIGLSNAKTDAFNLDASYRATEQVFFNVFYSHENVSSLLVANVNPAGAAGFSDPSWSADMKEKVDTYGVSVKLLQVASRWDLGGDYIRSHATSPYALTAGLGAVSTAATYNGIAGTFSDFPNTFSTSDTLRFSAKYSIDKKSAIRFSYGFQKLSSADPLMYNGLQTGAATGAVAGSATAAVGTMAGGAGTAVTAGNIMPTSQLMPTNEQAPNYKVQSIGVTYIYSFQ